jgi:hypothetical protein
MSAREAALESLAMLDEAEGVENVAVALALALVYSVLSLGDELRRIDESSHRAPPPLTFHPPLTVDPERAAPVR